MHESAREDRWVGSEMLSESLFRARLRDAKFLVPLLFTRRSLKTIKGSVGKAEPFRTVLRQSR